MSLIWWGGDVAKVVRMFRRRIFFYGLTFGEWGIGLIHREPPA